MIRFGIHDERPQATVAAKFPGISIDRVFIPGVQTRAADLVDKHRRLTRNHYKAGITPVVSVKLDPHAVVAGDHGPQLDAYAEYLATVPETWVVYWHEPENDMSGGWFAAAFAVFRDAIRAAAPAVPVGYSAMAYQWRPNSTTTKDPAAWSVDADFYGVDAYSGGGVFGAGATFATHPGVRRWYSQLVEPSGGADRWGLTERGFKAPFPRSFPVDSARARTIRREAAQLDAFGSLPLAYILWNTPGTEGNTALVSGPKALAAFRAMVATHGAPGTG